MKKVLASLFAVYSMSSGQAPPPLPGLGAAPQAPQTTATAAPQNPQTTAAAATPQTTAAAPAQTTTTAAAPPQQPQTTAAAAPPQPVPAVTSTTAAPQPVTTAYVNPYCPANAGVGKPTGWGIIDEACVYPTDVASDWQGKLRCNDYSCCKCAQINCGFQGYPCEQVQFGDSGAVGVKSINVNGVDAYGYVGSSGAKLECNGLESCKDTFIRGNYLSRGQCTGDFGCQQAEITVYNPAPQFIWQCNGLMSCLDLKLDIIIGTPGQQCPPGGSGQIYELGTIEFNGQQAAQNAQVSIRNYGCDQVLIKNLECMNPTACPNTIFNLEGNIVLETCALLGMRNINSLQPVLRACALGMGAQQPMQPGPINPSLPTFPVQPLPVYTTSTTQQPLPVPSTPVQPLPVYTTTTTTQAPLPSFPQTVTSSTQQPFPVPTFGQPQPTQPTQPAIGLLASSNQQLKCDNSKTFCGGQSITIEPRNNFVLECAAIGGCSAMTLTLNVGYDPVTMLPIERIDSFKFTNTNAGTGATIYVNNVMGAYAMPLHVGDIRCEKPASCVGLTVIAGDMVDIWNTNVDCSQPFYCSGCTIKQGTVERPCNYQTAQTATNLYPFAMAQPQPVSYQFPVAFV